MASQTKPESKAEFNSFVQGLITEASPLNFPVNASLAEENFELNRDGTRDRRRGMDWESPFSYNDTGGLTTASYNTFGFNTYIWKSPGGFVDSEVLVVQTGNRLTFYDNTVNSISAEGFLATSTLTFSDLVKYSFGQVNGKLVVVAGDPNVAVFDFTGGTSFPLLYKSLKVRDFWGIEIEEPFESNLSQRLPFTATTREFHIWNMMNQGWGIPRQGEVKYHLDSNNRNITDFDPGVVDPLNYFTSLFGLWPAQDESILTGLQFQPSIANVVNRPSEQMILSIYNESRNTGALPSAGYFVIDLLRRGQSRVDAQAKHNAAFGAYHFLSSNPADFTPGGATCAVGFSGRMFFSGFSGDVVQPDKRSPSLESFVVFSQLVKNDADIEKCYQEGDPTSREGTDVVDTDGGYIRVSGAAKIVSMKPLGASLIVFATNGVWEISGGSDYGFTATNYKVSRISTAGAFTESSIVEEVGRIFYWSLDGIYMISNDQLGSRQVQNISQTTIQTYYDSLSTITKQKAAGVYDPYAKKVRWVYNEGIAFTSASDSKELVLDSVLNAFTINSLGNVSNSIETVGAFPTAPFRSGTVDEDVLVGDDQVFSVGDLVLVESSARISGLQSVKYLVLLNVDGVLKHTFSLYNNIRFIDWESYNGIGVDAKAFLITGSQIAGDSSVHKQIPYLTMHMRRTETGYDGNGNPAPASSCKIRSQWNFANSAASHKWSDLFQAYRYTNPFLIVNPTYDNGFELISTKNKLRGRGKAFSLYMETEPLKDCRIVGWNLAVNGNSVT